MENCLHRTVIPGLYQLRIRLRKSRTIPVGALGPCRFLPGWYVYTGSARNGLEQRIRRHLRRHEKRKHWHIDYLLEYADRTEPFVLPHAAISECELHESLSGGTILFPGFGSSDCRCRSHLAFFSRKPRMNLLASNSNSGDIIPILDTHAAFVYPWMDEWPDENEAGQWPGLPQGRPKRSRQS